MDHDARQISLRQLVATVTLFALAFGVSKISLITGRPDPMFMVIAAGILAFGLGYTYCGIHAFAPRILTYMIAIFLLNLGLMLLFSESLSN